MNILRKPEQAIASANHSTASPPVVIIIADTGNQHLPSPTSNIIDIDPAHLPTNHRHESRLQTAIRAEQDYLQETCTDFMSATGKFLGAIFRWLVWRLVLPVSVAGILIAFLK